MPKSISVVIPNYNGQDLLRQNLPSVFAALQKSEVAYEIIVADDASHDNSIDFLKENYPQIIIVQNPINLGFASNINTGIQKASKDLVFALNTDVQLTDNYFIPLLKYFENPKTFGVTGCTIAWDNDTIQDAAKLPIYSFKSVRGTTNYLPTKLLTQNKLQNNPLNLDLKSDSETDSEKNVWLPTIYLTGSNALIDRKKMLEIGGFCDFFSPYYSEDFEICIRAWRLGYGCYYEHKAICRHPNSVTINKYSKKQKIKLISTRNKFYLNYLHREGFELLLWATVLFGKCLVSWIKLDWVFYKSMWLFLKNIDEAKEFKNKFKALQQKHKTEDLSLKRVCYQIPNKIQGIEMIIF
jgi:GT2 family glycosyltransferase